MSSSSRPSTDRNQVRSPNIRFRVFSQNNGECKHEFSIRLKDITWENFLRNLFGPHTFEEHQLPTIVLLGDKHRIVLQHTNIKQLIRDALEELFKGFSVNLLVPDFENYFTAMSSNGTIQHAVNEDQIKRKKAVIGDFLEIFSKRINLPTMDQFVQSTPHVRFVRSERDEASRGEVPARDKISHLGELQVKRLNNKDMIELLKEGANLILKTSDNKMVSLKFMDDQLPTFNDTRCEYKNLDLVYECNDLKLPVIIDEEIKFLFNRDAEFVQKLSKTLDAAERNLQENVLRLKKLQETMRKLKSTAGTTDASTSGATNARASTAVVSATATTTAPPMATLNVESANTTTAVGSARPHLRQKFPEPTQTPSTDAPGAKTSTASASKVTAWPSAAETTGATDPSKATAAETTTAKASVRVYPRPKFPKPTQTPSAAPPCANTVETTSTASPSKVPAWPSPAETADTTDPSKATASAALPLTFFASPLSADALLAATSEGSSNEGAQTASRVYRRPHRSAQKRTKRGLAAAALANASPLSTNNATCPYSTYSSHDLILNNFQNLHVSEPRSSAHADMVAFRSQFANSSAPLSKQSPKTTADARQEDASNTPAWLGELLDKFRTEILLDVKNTVKDVLEDPFGRETKPPLFENQIDEQYHYKTLDGSPSTAAGKHKHHEKQHHGGAGGSGSSKKKSVLWCAKRAGGITSTVYNVSGENKTVSPYTWAPSSEKILEISNGLFVFSKSGFRVRMPRNASLTIQINIGKLAKYRHSLEDTDLRVQSVSNSIECCVKRTTAAASSVAPKCSPLINKDFTAYYDVRIKSKDKSGKFRLYFNVINGGKVIGHSFKVDVRVKKEFTLPFGCHSTEGLTWNYEEEALDVPLLGTTTTTTTNATQQTTPNLVDAQTQKSLSSSAHEQPRQEDHPSTNEGPGAELADEGIGGNQEDFYSPTSDSEYSDVSDSKPDTLLMKDEGIDTCYRSSIVNVPEETVSIAGPSSRMVTVANGGEFPSFDSESDTDSSISFLMDENEARDELNDSLDVVQLPSCFIPNAELTDDVLPVRIKRKNSTAATSKRTINENTVDKNHTRSSGNESPQQQQQQQQQPSAFDTSTLTPVAIPSTTGPGPAPASGERTNVVETVEEPAVTISDDEEDDDVQFLNESIASAAVDHAYHRSLYPNLHGYKECVRPAPGTSNDAAAAASADSKKSEPSPPKQQRSPANPRSSSNAPASEPYPTILPEKLFEMWKNAVPIQRQMQDTVTSVFSSVSNEINNAANAARTAAASAAAAAASIVPDVPTPPSPSSVTPTVWSVRGDTGAAAAAAGQPTTSAAASNDSASSSSSSTGAVPENRSSHSQPPEGKRQKSVNFTFTPRQQQQQQKQQQQQQQSEGQTTADYRQHIDSIYSNLSEQMQSNLLILHDMGFTDDQYMIYLLEQSSNDLNKVIESLINYSTY